MHITVNSDGYVVSLSKTDAQALVKLMDGRSLDRAQEAEIEKLYNALSAVDPKAIPNEDEI